MYPMSEEIIIAYLDQQVKNVLVSIISEFDVHTKQTIRKKRKRPSGFQQNCLINASERGGGEGEGERERE